MKAILPHRSLLRGARHALPGLCPLLLGAMARGLGYRLLRIPLPMHRMLLVFLLVFLPLQSIWAAASPYCGHESAPQASHFGHHVHDHQAAAHQADLHGSDAKAAPAEPSQAGETSDHKALTSSGAVDMDCHACHGAGSGMVWSAGAPALVVAVARPAAQTAPVLVHPPLSRPERPNWPSLA